MAVAVGTPCNTGVAVCPEIGEGSVAVGKLSLVGVADGSAVGEANFVGVADGSGVDTGTVVQVVPAGHNVTSSSQTLPAASARLKLSIALVVALGAVKV